MGGIATGAFREKRVAEHKFIPCISNPCSETMREFAFIRLWDNNAIAAGAGESHIFICCIRPFSIIRTLFKINISIENCLGCKCKSLGTTGSLLGRCCTKADTVTSIRRLHFLIYFSYRRNQGPSSGVFTGEDRSGGAAPPGGAVAEMVRVPGKQKDRRIAR